MSDTKLIEITSPSGVRMLEALPDMYEEIQEARALMQTEGVEIDDLNGSLDDAINQAIVDRATWGLSYWEDFLGIKTDISKPYAQRRSVIKSKIRGTGTVTVELLQKVVSSYQNGTIEVTQNPALYQITINFSGFLGAPPNMEDVRAAIEAIKPAHLVVVYKFRYLSIAEVEVMTIYEIEHTTLDHLAWG
ncbi:putative phage tail protein [Bacillus sp. 3255]|uniref:putative phage tail protein n=1 Tax=Bacillus sp. 3255 TaxID=2817904 RepID=UPI002867764F|nr:putative phage tail protein [Bacillus sp. 3255]MDR6883802.1 hypothetical protein [Bacillus sp. 3255]